MVVLVDELRFRLSVESNPFSAWCDVRSKTSPSNTLHLSASPISDDALLLPAIADGSSLAIHIH